MTSSPCSLTGADSSTSFPPCACRSIFHAPPCKRLAAVRPSSKISPQLAQTLRQTGQREGATLFMTLLAAYQVLLSRYAGQTDFAVGSPISNRCRKETEPLIGFFINMLPFRASLAGQVTFRDVLKRTRQTALEAYEHQDLPFEIMVEEARVERQLNQTPVFQAAFSLLRDGAREWKAGGLRFELKPFEKGPAKFDLTLALREQSEGLKGIFVYNADLFDESRMARMSAHFVALCEKLCAAPDAPINSHSLLNAESEQRVLALAHGVDTAYPSETLAALFEKCAGQHANQIAVTDAREEVSYRRLNAEANRMAHFLRGQNLIPETPVGLPATRSWKMIAAMVGIVKAGLAYVPLDLDQPETRLQKMRSICGHLFDLERDYSAFPAENPPPVGSPANIAYVIFTSGSTGQPKGVCVPHRAISRLVCASDYLQFLPSDGVAQAASPTFDAAVFEMWGALLNGARLVIIPREALLSPQQLGTLIESQRISVMLLTTPLFHQFAAEAPSIFKPLRCLLFGGDAADAGLVRKVFEQGRPGLLLNAYGPTENGVISTVFEVTEAPEREIPIGHPIANTEVLLLDADGHLVPDGVEAEICVGGPGLALGYHGLPELTAERFINWRGRRLYRTGDLARRRADGNLLFIGRRDHQIKHRGYRIELVEIETALRGIPGVDDAVAIYDQGRLMACAATDQSAESLTATARELLPDYMLPQPLLTVARLPLTVSGKVDREAVLKLARDWQPLPSRQPSTEDERAIAKIWSELLEIETPGLDDDFFASGGHSLLAIQLLSRIRRELGHDITIRQLFEKPTIAGLADAIPAPGHPEPLVTSIQSPTTTPDGRYHHIVEIQAGAAGRPPLFLIPGGGGGEIEFLVYKRLAAYIGEDQPIYGLRAKGWDDAHQPHDSLHELVQDYAAAIQRIQPHGPYLIAGECVGGVVACEIAQLLKNSGEEIALLMLIGAEKPSLWPHARIPLEPDGRARAPLHDRPHFPARLRALGKALKPRSRGQAALHPRPPASRKSIRSGPHRRIHPRCARELPPDGIPLSEDDHAEPPVPLQRRHHPAA
ncbi:MAG: AMP-binding protein [Chthoniobacteraceae bacterium]